jgi:8-oxo-dGTP diphosphatase
VKRYVLGFAFFQNKVVLIRKNRPEWQAGKLNGVGGKIEPTDQNAFAAMAREFYEEAGVLLRPHRWRHVLLMEWPDAQVFVMSALLTPSEADCVRTKTDEEVSWHSDIPDDVIPNLRYIVPLCMEYDFDPTRTPVLYYKWKG